MNGELENGSRVSFSVKELLVEISRDIKDLRVDLSTKADVSVVNVLAAQITSMNERLITIETQDKQKNRLENLWFPIVASSVVGLIVGAISVLLYLKG